MKGIKKILAVMVAMVMALGLTATNVFANDDETPTGTASITINRDSSWQASETEDRKATYTYYKILDADISQATADAEEGGKLSGKVVYTVDTAQKATAINGTNVLEAKLASDGKYYVTKKADATDEKILTAIQDMSKTAFGTGTAITSDTNPVVIGGLTDGYYYIEASNGKDVVVETIGNVTITEKNDYPTIDKKQKKADGTYTDDAVSQEVGTYVDYQVTVHIPTDATKQIAVIDKMSAGLEYDSTTGLTLDPNIAYSTLESTDAGYDANATWQIKFTDATVIANRGNDIVITFRAKVTSVALTDTGKENEVTLNYDNGNYILKDDVDYEIYFGGIYKVDPDATGSVDMSGVKFELTAGNDAVNVTYDSTHGYYVVDPTSTSNEVETREDNGSYTIKIRGLDGDKTYKLTETVTKPGYNLLNAPVELTLTKDEGTAFSSKAANTYDRVENKAGSTLPSTGGIGTTIFYAIGSILVVGAGILLISKKRMFN